MRTAVLTLAIVLLGAAARAETPADFPAAISVTGEARISVAPDIAFVDAGVATDARSAREASDANNTAMAKVFAALKAANIDARDIQTSRLSLQPQYAPNRSSGPTSITGYRASNRVTVRIHDVSKVAGVIDTLVGAGANDIGNVSFSVSQASQLLDDAREKAVADARRKAEIYAKAAGVTLGAPLSISEEGAPQPVFRGKMVAGMAAAPTPIAQGEETLSISVSVTWAIKGQ
jgi:uncharacterized protein YggE